ncbi:nucleotidyltransferase family protein [Octadecabacter sp.]|nr:nucleotidyltransferase family protein [Octadecabacter sp.]
MITPTSILLFAAGLGTRMAPLTNTRPKPLVEVAGRALLDHALDHCDGLNAVVNVHYYPDQIENHLAGRGISISDERAELLETGGGLKHALPILGDGPVYTMNTDAVWNGPNPLQRLEERWRPEMNGLLLMIPRRNAVGHTGQGDFDIGADGRITRGHGYVYSGAQIIRTDLLASINKASFSMWDLWTPLLEGGTLFGTAYEGAWCDVGRPESIPIAEDLLKGVHSV